jgi:hypothetical protein
MQLIFEFLLNSTDREFAMKLTKLLLIFLFIFSFSSCEENAGGSSLPGGNSELPAAAAEVMRTGDLTSTIDQTMRGPTATYCPDCTEDRDQVTGMARTASERQLLENFTRLGGDPIAFQQAMCFLNTHGRTNFQSSGAGYNNGIRIEQQRYVTINDLNKPSTEKRLFILDRQTGQVTAYHSGHGNGGGRNTHERISYFSNNNGSNTNPRGFFITGNTYNSNQSFGEGVRLHGLQRGINDASMARGIVIHGAPYTPAGLARSNEANPSLTGPRSGRSHGCTTVANQHYREVERMLSAGREGSSTRGGSLYYNFSPTERSAGARYCGDNLMVR